MYKTSEKGKYFTDRVSKKPVEVSISTLHGHVRGQIYVLPTQRVKDVLNNSNEEFLALTDAVVTAGDGVHQEVKFVALNKRHIISVVPINEDEVHRPDDEEGYIPY